MMEQAVRDLVRRIGQMEEHMNTADPVIRDATSRAQPTGNPELRRQQQQSQKEMQEYAKELC